MSVGLFPNADLPPECDLAIFSYLGAQDLGRCCQVCKEWRKLASDGTLWKRLFPGKVFPSGVNAKEFINRHTVISKDEVVEHIQEFINIIPLHKKGIFTCLFPFNPRCTIRVELGVGNVHLKGKGNLTKTCIFMKDLNCADGIQKLGASLIDDHSLPNISIFNIRIIEDIKSSSIRRFEIKLPIAAQSENLDVENQINNILATKMNNLAAEAQRPRKNKITYYGIAITTAAVAAATIAINMYLNAANTDEQS